MSRYRSTALAALTLALLGARPLAAQIDYRNLDDDRPVRTEDAYPVERYAFEFLLPYTFERERGGERLHVVVPELAYGLFANGQVGLKLPLAAVNPGAGLDTEWGLAGPRLFALYNFNTESPTLPALAVRADLALPVGSLAGDDARMTIKAIATRSWGLIRAHLNGAVSLGADRRSAAVETPPEWSLSAAVDRTFFRQSLLLIGEVAAQRTVPGAPTEVTAAVGGRYQLTPTFVLDLGLSRRLSRQLGPDIGLTLGLSHAFAFAGLLPGGSR